MDKKEIQSIIQDAVEDEIPISQIDLWQTVKANLVERQTQQGVKMNKNRSRGVSRFAYAILGIVTLLSAALLTPQGRAFAQNIVHFFTRAESNSFPAPTAEIDPSAPTAAPPSPLISITEAEELAGFELAQFPSVPQGFEYIGARMYSDAVSIEYAVPSGGGNLILMQSKVGYIQSDWDHVPVEAVTSVKIGDMDAEFVQGTFVVMAGETSATWMSDAPIFRLRWFEDGTWFDLTKYGNVEPIEYLDMNGLIALAESLK